MGKSTSQVDWLDKKILFFGGKGGVGKTTSATACAMLAAERGRRTLLASTDPAHNTSDIIERKVGRNEQRLGENLWGIEIDSEKAADEYIHEVSHNLRSRVKPALRSEIDRQLEMARISPGAEEAALFDRIADLVQRVESTYDMIIFDTAPTGHTLRLLSLPEMMEAWIDGLISRRKQVNEMSALWKNLTFHEGGENPDDPVERVLMERKRKFARMRRYFLDPSLTSFIFVLNPERLPINETDKAIHLLQKYHIPVGGLVVNRVFPDDLPDHPFFLSRKQLEQEYLKDIEKRFKKFPQVFLPLLDRDVVGREPLSRIVDSLRPAIRF